MKKQPTQIISLPSIIISCTMLLCVLACSKETDPVIEPNLQEFSFTYNGTEYYRATELFPELEVSSIGEKVSIAINMIELFGGVVYLDEAGCAFLEPDSSEVYHDEHCNLTRLVNGNIVPIDSVEVFSYQSGALNVSVSDCTTVTIDIFGPVTFFSCRASGTFELTLVNKNNETIEIKNGMIRNMAVFPK